MEGVVAVVVVETVTRTETGRQQRRKWKCQFQCLCQCPELEGREQILDQWQRSELQRKTQPSQQRGYVETGCLVWQSDRKEALLYFFFFPQPWPKRDQETN